jgi:hypothetical protein
LVALKDNNPLAILNRAADRIVDSIGNKEKKSSYIDDKTKLISSQ